MNTRDQIKVKMKTIIITGTPGTGKTEFSRILSKKSGYIHINLNEIIKKERWFDSFDKENDCVVVDEKKLAKNLKKMISKFKKQGKKGLIIDSHIAQCLPKSMVDLCIVLKCELKELRKRLTKRKYHEKKIMDNLEAEIFKVCEEEANKRKYKVIIVESTKRIPKSIISSIF